jgi:hypothetical protein
MNTSTDSYHNLLIQGGQDGRDMPTTKTDALEEFEANIEALCSDLGIEYSLTLTREITINDLFGSWARAEDSGDSLFITITGHATKTLVISRNDCSRIGQVKDFFADANLLDLTLSLRSLTHVLACRPSRLIISTGNKPGHKLHSQPWWGRCLTMKDTHSLRELAEEFGATPGALNKAFLALNNSN